MNVNRTTAELNDYRKKWLIVTLLFLSCLLSLWLLLSIPDPAVQPLGSFSEVDSLVQERFLAFNIPDGQVRFSDITVDTVFQRRTYRVSVPPRFSRTDFHLNLQRAMLPYGISLPARVHFPGRDMDIHLLFEGTVIGTIRLQNDPGLATPPTDYPEESDG